MFDATTLPACFTQTACHAISLEQLIAIIVLSVHCPVNTLLGHSVYIYLLTEMTDSLRGRGHPRRALTL